MYQGEKKFVLHLFTIITAVAAVNAIQILYIFSNNKMKLRRKKVLFKPKSADDFI